MVPGQSAGSRTSYGNALLPRVTPLIQRQRLSNSRRVPDCVGVAFEGRTRMGRDVQSARTRRGAVPNPGHWVWQSVVQLVGSSV